MWTVCAIYCQWPRKRKREREKERERERERERIRLTDNTSGTLSYSFHFPSSVLAMFKLQMLAKCGPCAQFTANGQEREKERERKREREREREASFGKKTDSNG